MARKPTIAAEETASIEPETPLETIAEVAPETEATAEGATETAPEILPELEPETEPETEPDEEIEEREEELRARRERIIVPFLNEFGSSDRRKTQIRKLLEEGGSAKEFAEELGKSPTHKKYLGSRFKDAAARLARVD